MENLGENFHPSSRRRPHLPLPISYGSGSTEAAHWVKKCRKIITVIIQYFVTIKKLCLRAKFVFRSLMHCAVSSIDFDLSKVAFLQYFSAELKLVLQNLLQFLLRLYIFEAIVSYIPGSRLTIINTWIKIVFSLCVFYVWKTITRMKMARTFVLLIHMINCVWLS